MAENDYAPGVYNVDTDPVLNPTLAGAALQLIENGAAEPFLPAPPSGYLWNLPLVQYENADGAAAVTVTMREVAPSGPRIVDSRSLAPAAGAPLVGGLITPYAVTLQCGGAGSGFHVSVLAQLLPAHLVRTFYVSLTGAYQVVDVGSIPENAVLKPLQVSWTPNANNTAAWFLNTDPAGRNVQFRVTRGSLVLQTPSTAGAVTGSSRLTTNAFVPPLQRGDVLEARCTAAPAAPVIVGAALMLVPQLSTAP